MVIENPILKHWNFLLIFFNVDMNTLFEHNSQNISYYLNPETAKLAQAIHDDPDLRILLDASRDLEPEDIKFVVDLVKKLKLKERGDHAD